MPLQQLRPDPLNIFRYAMYFDGIDDYVAVPDGIIPYNSMNWTVMAWVAPVFTGCVSCVVIYYQGASEGEMQLNPPSLGVKLSNGNWYYTPTYNTPTVVFTHVAGVRYNGTSLLFYVNGNQVESASIPAYNLFETSGFHSSIGTYNREGGSFMGYIYNVLIYNFALSQSQIQYNMANPDNPIREGLLLWLQADPAYISGNTWYDLSGNNNNGTIYGATLVQLTPSDARQLQAVRTLSPVR
jgi:hypothetical protein